MPLPASLVPLSMQRAADALAPNGSTRQGTVTLVFTIRQLSTGLILKQHKLVLMPQTFERTTETRVALYYTQRTVQADLPADAPLGITLFNIAGHTGFRGVLTDAAPNPLLDPSAGAVTGEALADVATSVFANLTSGARLGGTSRSMIDGAAAIKDLDDTLRAYFLPEEQPETSSVAYVQDLRLEFLDLSVPTSAQDPIGRGQWEIIPHRNLVTLRRDAQRPFLFFYTLQFAALAQVNEPITDDVLDSVTNPQTTLRRVFTQLSNVVRNTRDGVNTLRFTFQQYLIGQFFGPVNTLLESAAGLGDAVRGFADDSAALIHWPLYAQRLLSSALEAPQYAVDTLGDAALHLASVLEESSLGLARSTPLVGTLLEAGINDVLTVRINGENPVRLVLGTLTTGADIASTIEAQVQAQTPEHDANLAGYRDFTATYTEEGQYVLTSGTLLSSAARVEIVTNADTALTPGDASATLGLGVANGGTEQPGSTQAALALTLLYDVAAACQTLQAFPDWFAAQLDDRDATLAAQYAPDAVLPRPVVHGDQHLVQVRVLPGDTLHTLAGRAQVPFETLALTNGLAYPYILQEPATLLTGRFTSADRYHATDDRLLLVPNQYQGERIDTLGGAGAGQSRYLLSHSADTFLVDQAWDPLVDGTTDYAIRAATNPIIQTSVVTSATAQTLTDSALFLVIDSQRNRRIQVGSGPGAGQQRRVVAHDAHVYLLDAPWDVIPEPGTLYFVLSPRGRSATQQRLVGDWVSIPRPSTQTRRPQIRGRLSDVSTITGRARSREAQLFGCDWLLDHGALVWDPTRQDAVTVEGLPNLRQALVHLTNLPRGALEYAPALGSYVHENLGQPATAENLQQLLISLDRTIRQDPRVARLSGTQLVSHGGTTLLLITATAITGDTVDRIDIR
jgi:hypothetical protein